MYATDDGNISPQSTSGATISTTQYTSSYHEKFLPAPKDVLQGSPTLSASPSRRSTIISAATDDIPHVSVANEDNAPSHVVFEGDSHSTYLSILCQGKSLNVNCNQLVCSKKVQGRREVECT